MGLLDFMNFGLQGLGTLWNQSNTERQWKREDTAIQRRVADLKAAGLSPVLAAGSGASSGPAVHIDAPQFSPSVENMSAQAARTRADEALAREMFDLKDYDAQVSRSAADYLRRSDQQGGHGGTYDLAKSIVERNIAENKEVVRNIGIYRDFEVPSVGSAGDQVISNSLMLKNLFPDLDPKAAGGVGVLFSALQSLLGTGGNFYSAVRPRFVPRR